MRPATDFEWALASRAVNVELLPTAAVVSRINDLLRGGDLDWAGALHLTY